MPFALPCEDEVLARLHALRASAEVRPDAGAEAGWQWLDELTTLWASDKDGSRQRLDTLFEYGHQPRLTGPYEGRVLATMLPVGLEEVVRLLTSLWMPWHGKVFEPNVAQGYNLLSDRAKWPAKVIWPLYETRDSEFGLSGFRFETRLEPGVHDPETDVLALDYKPVPGTPGLVLDKLRDEIIEIVPGCYLTKVFYRSGASYSLVAYVGLRPAATPSG